MSFFVYILVADKVHPWCIYLSAFGICPLGGVLSMDMHPTELDSPTLWVCTLPSGCVPRGWPLTHPLVMGPVSRVSISHPLTPWVCVP